MQRYFIHFAYDGTAYHGWQIQPNGVTVQEVLRRTLSMLLRAETSVIGAGRTDTGVHARRMTAHFDGSDDIDCAQLAYRLNNALPADVAVSGVERVPAHFHARFSAVSRTYHYYVHTVKSPFLRTYSCELHYRLDFEAMNEAAALLTRYDDFAAFCKSGSDNKSTLCEVSEARWTSIGEGQWCFIITANRFLRNMVRAVVGTLIEVGRHRIDIETFRRIVEGKSRTAAGESMPACGLFLVDIVYPER